MDTALKLRKLVDEGKDLKENHIMELLNVSELVKELTSSLVEKPLPAVWRIIALAEIPYAGLLDYTKKLVNYIFENLSTPSGFSLTGKEADILPCYNAMLVEALSKLGYGNYQAVQNALGWILQYQSFERNSTSSWNGKGVLKYGGCLKATPCYIGISKSVKALLYYKKSNDNSDAELQGLIDKGVNYILRHKLYNRLSNEEPINKHILDLSFPASYQLNIVELLDIATGAGYIADVSCHNALEYIRSKQTKEGQWKINNVYKAEGYISFDKRGHNGDWITYLLQKYLDASVMS